MHLILAFRAFFAALFGRRLPPEVIPVGLLPSATGDDGSGTAGPGAVGDDRAMAETLEELERLRSSVAQLQTALAARDVELKAYAEAKTRPDATAKAGANSSANSGAKANASASAPASAPQSAKTSSPEAVAVTTLALLQTQGRLLDFLAEDIGPYEDADIGAAVREIHRDLKRTINEHFKIVPIRAEEEDARIQIPAGYDPLEVKLVGNVVGKPPFSGVLKHKGWRAAEVRLPQIQDGTRNLVVVPAEVEI
ncbi:MAG: DUF2760 domain-containing protein [Deltaproteobacteria bacterium]|nr:DUF2760 domain-containing protein [Deltaproteobacteria bacterium]